MKNELQASAHCVGESNLHLQITPAYRRAVFVDSLVRELTLAYIYEKARDLGVHLAAIEFAPDHVHLFITEWHKVSVSQLAGQLKGYSSYMLRRGHKELFADQLWGEKFWSSGYFYRTVGVVTAETVRKYVEEGQTKHWAEQEQKKQTTLLSYAA